MSGRRVVVSGCGVMCAIGEGPEAFWRALLAGRSGVRRVRRTTPAWYRNPLACEIETADPLVPDRPELGRASALLLRTVRAAVEDAGLAAPAPYAAARMGVVVGSALLDLRDAEDMACAEAPAPRFIARFSLSATVARALGFRGRHVTFANACGAGTLAVAVAADLVSGGALDLAIAAGADTITESILGFSDKANLRAPTMIAPFDRRRGGPLMAEGAAAVVLEADTAAGARGARIWGEVAGAGISCDAVSTQKTAEEGVAAALAETLTRAGVRAEDVDYVCAHGTATDTNDAAETGALKRVLGAHARRIPVSAIKSMIGHSSGASGTIAVVASLLAIRDGVVPPTINLLHPDEGFDLNYVPNHPQPWPVRTALVDGFGFGGTNCCVLLRRYEAQA
jgi:3-oxoacyl-[acyl-carrier-protein] synthase II